MGEWIWKGQPHEPASVEAVFAESARLGISSAHDYLSSGTTSIPACGRAHRVWRQTEGDGKATFGYRYRNGRPVVTSPLSKGRVNEANVQLNDPTLSILKQHVNVPARQSLANDYDRIRLYREWVFGHKNTPLRDPQRTDLRGSARGGLFQSRAVPEAHWPFAQDQKRSTVCALTAIRKTGTSRLQKNNVLLCRSTSN